MASIRWPGGKAWLYSAKTCAAALLALFLALYLNLDRPGWAVTTVFIASQPFAGATQSKSVYRFLGTLIGAVATVLMVPNLVQSPEMLSLALAAWVSACLYLSLQDRSPRSYVFMLAGYSAAFIGFPSVETPISIFDTAVSRVEEIMLGVTCSSLVHAIVFPNSVRSAVIHSIDDWLRDTRLWCAQALAYVPTGSEENHSPLLTQVAAYPLNIEMLTAHIAFEGNNGRQTADLANALLQHLSLLLPILAAVEQRLAIARRQQIPIPDSLGAVFEHIVAWLNAPGLAKPTGALRQELRRVEAELGRNGANWDSLLWSSTVARLHELLKVMQACEHLRERLGDGRYAKPRKRLPTVRHIDRGLAGLSAMTAFISVLAGCAFWITTGWPDGASVPMIAAVACSFFATLDSPLPSMKLFAKYVVVSVVITLIYSSLILPRANSFEVAALMLAPAFLALGLLMAAPSTTFIAMVLSTNIATLLGLSNRYAGDFIGTLNNAVATVLGIALTMVTMSIVRARTPAWTGQRILRAGLRDLQATLEGGQAPHSHLQRQAFVQRMLDRLHILMPRVKANALANVALDSTLLAELRLGANILDLRRKWQQLAVSDVTTGVGVNAVIADIGQYLRVRARDLSASPPRVIQQHIDGLLDHVRNAFPHHRELLILLVNIRLVLYPHEPCEILQRA
ncbi:FUSC family protein [Pseudomonas typographi]|uniref:FUSC family protein n=1 Tax=Pseudomonas typographi TaxID=2715964 RepID=A0ABR7YZX0_9PSED|nr:FUSC family protein [Pseudomonas typographi]MBD1598732.1 FUSC family protein [Pseudomonas typographi]